MAARAKRAEKNEGANPAEGSWPPAGSPLGNDAILALAARLKRLNAPFALATVVRTEGATSAKAGAKAIVGADGAIEGWIGGGCTQPAVLSAAKAALADGRARLIGLRPEEEGEAGGEGPTMGCRSGGSVEVFVEPMLPRPALYLLGASPAGQVLAGLARLVGFSVTAAVQKSDLGAYAEAERVIEGFDLGEAAPGVIVVATQGKGDRQALEAALRADVGAIAFISSRRKAEALKQDLVARGHDRARVAAIRAPAGLDLGAASPEEVAVAILAEIVRDRRRGLDAASPESAAGEAAGVTTQVLPPVAGHCRGARSEEP